MNEVMKKKEDGTVDWEHFVTNSLKIQMGERAAADINEDSIPTTPSRKEIGDMLEFVELLTASIEDREEFEKLAKEANELIEEPTEPTEPTELAIVDRVQRTYPWKVLGIIAILVILITAYATSV